MSMLSELFRCSSVGRSEDWGKLSWAPVIRVKVPSLLYMFKVTDMRSKNTYTLFGTRYEQVLSARTPAQLKMAHEQLRLKEASLQTLVRNEYLVTPCLSACFGIDCELGR